MKTVILGFSGGVDSAVCAVLLRKAGYAVQGVYLDNTDDAALCCAEETAASIGIPLSVIDIRQELEEKVCTPFLQSYLHGRTPNPCILCNPALKFRTLLSVAEAGGANAIATGHYARTQDGMLFRGHSENDQSYMLCRLFPSQAKRLLLPLGPYEKKEVRELARSLFLPVADKPDSMEICFIPDQDHIEWLARRASVPGPGDILYEGKVIGAHKGIHTLTVGQRLPGLYAGRRLYVYCIDADKNEIRACLWDDLFTHEFSAYDTRWLVSAPKTPIEARVQVRHTRWERPECTIYPDDSLIRVHCDEPLRAPAPGQAAAFYQGDRLIGGGWIVQKMERRDNF